jgi:hypothetical protein
VAVGLAAPAQAVVLRGEPKHRDGRLAEPAQALVLWGDGDGVCTHVRQLLRVCELVPQTADACLPTLASCLLCVPLLGLPPCLIARGLRSRDNPHQLRIVSDPSLPTRDPIPLGAQRV